MWSHEYLSGCRQGMVQGKQRKWIWFGQVDLPDLQGDFAHIIIQVKKTVPMCSDLIRGIPVNV